MYKRCIKRMIDFVLSAVGFVLLIPIFLLLVLMIKLDSPGPAIFKQKRVGKNKTFFNIYKFRTMRTETPKEMPTHMLADPDKYITRVGRLLRKSSLDELPQIVNILFGQMAIIGPRPALWNQYDLIAERDKYGANDISPGLTGWAQVNGRDELPIEIKAKFDGEYVQRMSFLFDLKCFLATIAVVTKRGGVVEGNQKIKDIDQEQGGEHMPENHSLKHENNNNENEKLSEEKPTRILITGANSYIGRAFEKWLAQWPDKYVVGMVGMIDGSWREKSFSGYDVVFHVAGIAHIKETKKNESLYYSINRDLAHEVAKKAKRDGVRQFIFLSSMSVYGVDTGVIDKNTPIKPKSAYGNSKLQAEELINILADDTFIVAVLRPPMVYGKGCKGNYPRLAKLALKTPIFPLVDNKRSMIYIDNLSEFVKQVCDHTSGGLFFPQNTEYVNTSEMVRLIAEVHGKKIKFTKIFNPLLKLINNNTLNKIFGDLTYSTYISDRVSLISFYDTITQSEK